LKLMAAEDSLDEKRLTGTETSPKEIVAEARDRGGMGGLIYRQEMDPARARCRVQNAISCSDGVALCRFCG
jgi:hypothetical protein